MQNMTNPDGKAALYRAASALALITIGYNTVEGAVSVWFGLADDAISLFGFGLDSFVEVVSGIGVWHMIRRQQSANDVNPDVFERRALRITGSGFYLLAVGLVLTAMIDIIERHRPETTLWGIIVAVISIVSMQFLIHYKMKVGTKLNSPALLADAACSRVCLHLSIILLAASAGYALTGIGWLDSLGAIGIAWFSLREGREAVAKAKGLACCCAGKCGG